MASANGSCKFLLYISCLLPQFLLIDCGRTPLAPALYVFGGSIVDSGNNNFLSTQSKANYKPYGIDFPLGVTGRFTNGQTMADFIADSLGLPFAPSYLGLSEIDKGRIITGANYASGSAGILPETGSALGKNLCFDDQIDYFQETVKQHLSRVFNTPFELSPYLSKSIYIVAMGNNDYLSNYLQPANYNSSKIFTPQQFGPFLLEALKQRLTRLYELGARKFVVVNIHPLGCLPAVLNRANPQPNTSCVENVNRLVNIFNQGLPDKLLQLEQTLKGSTFVVLDAYRIVYDMYQNRFKYGLATRSATCCAVGNYSGSCLPNQQPCENRNRYLYWDAVHFTQQVHFILANGCWKGSSTCFPINIQQLIQKP